MPKIVKKNIINILEKWFINSKIYVNGGKYRVHYGKHFLGPVYPEITAYAINVALLFYQIRKKPIFLNRAEECAKYLIQISNGKGLPSYFGKARYVFDTGIFISSLLDLYEVTKKSLYLQESQRALNWILNFWNGKFFLPTNLDLHDNNWAHKLSVHLLKMSIPLLKAYKAFKNEYYKIIAEKLLQQGMKLQLSSGRFVINEKSRITISHPHCYATEGYIFAYLYTKCESYYQVASKSAKWLKSVQNKDGSLWYSYNTRSLINKLKTSKVSDATAQAVRIWKLMGVNRSGVEKGLEYLSKQLKDNGLVLTRRNFFIDNIFPKEIYSWPTFFYIHALLIQFGKMHLAKDIF